MTPEPFDEPEIAREANRLELARGFRDAARRAITLARRYRAEEGAGGDREKACIVQAREWRQAVRDLHAGRPVPALPARPGIARARAASSPDSERKTG